MLKHLIHTLPNINKLWLYRYNKLSSGLAMYLYFSVCMEDESSYQDYRKQLIGGTCSLGAVEKLARDIGQVHNRTHVSHVGEHSFQQLKQKFPYVEQVVNKILMLLETPCFSTLSIQICNFFLQKYWTGFLNGTVYFHQTFRQVWQHQQTIGRHQL